MSKLSQKEAFFRSGSLAATRVLTHETLDEAKVDRVTPALRRLMFENGAGMFAEVIANAHTGFIGAHSYMNNFGYLRENVFIGRFCSIGRRVSIGAFDHDMSGLTTSPVLSPTPARINPDPGAMTNAGSPDEGTRLPHTVIQSDVWIGDGVVIRPGVTIGTGAVIGASAVVAGDVAPYGIMGGVPAKPIRKRFPQHLCERLMRSEWWELPLDTLTTLKTHNVPEFLDRFEARASRTTEAYETFSIAE